MKVVVVVVVVVGMGGYQIKKRHGVVRQPRLGNGWGSKRLDALDTLLASRCFTFGSFTINYRNVD